MFAGILGAGAATNQDGSVTLLSTDGGGGGHPPPISSKSLLLWQCCGAKIIYFRLQLRLRLHFFHYICSGSSSSPVLQLKKCENFSFNKIKSVLQK